MAHYLMPFLLDMDDDPDMNAADRHVAIEHDWEQQNTIDAWLRGEIPYEAVLDMVADCGVDAYDYDETIADGIDRLVGSRTLVDCAGFPLVDLGSDRQQ
jgi:hypothetical protein